MKRLTYYPLILPNGSMKKLPHPLRFNDLHEHLGWFTSCNLRPPGEHDPLNAFVKEDGLTDDSPPNVIACLFGAPIVGPMVLFGSSDGDGDVRPPEEEPSVMAMVEAASRYQNSLQAIARMRTSPFEVVGFLSIPEEDLDEDIQPSTD